MARLIRFMFLVIITGIFAAASNGFCMDLKKETIPIIEKLQDGKAKISPDKKSIIDENGHIIGKETENINPPKNKPVANPADTAKDSSPPAPQLIFCSKKCAIITKHCYKDESENVVCINSCDRESLICE